MLGDINQLPPIKYGRPFEDMINSGQFETIKLTKNFRVKNGHDDPIIINSNNIINSMFYTVSPAENFILLNTKEESFENDIRMLIRHKGITVQNASHHKFITNTNDNNTKLNKIISEEIGNKIHKKAISCWMKDKKITMNYGIGDPVVFTKNNTYPGTFNGDQGVITGFSKEYLIVSLNGIKEEVIEDHENNKKKKKIDLSNIRIRLYRDRDSKCSGSCSCTGIIKNSCIQGCKCVCTCFYSVKNLLLAYSITVHKSQGSEYPSVYFYVDGAANKGFNNKRLSYTAITRAKEECMVIEGNVGLFECCSREAQSVHFGNLDQRIARIIEGEQKENREAEIKLINSILALVNRAPIVISK
jgi:exodeoxyribonuclease V alpha subunit